MLTLEDFKNGETDFLRMNVPYIAGIPYTKLRSHLNKHNIFITVGGPSQDSYTLYERALEKAGATLIATRLNSSGFKPLKLWFLENLKKPEAPSMTSTGSSFCSCCGTNVVKNPFVLMERILMSGYYSYAYILVNSMVYKMVKESFLNEYLTLDFTHTHDGKSFHIISFKKEDDKSSAYTKLYEKANPILVNANWNHREEVLNKLYKEFGINLKPMQELMFPSHIKSARETETYYYTGDSNYGIRTLGHDYLYYN